MTTQKKKKSAKQKRVLIGSVVVAVAIVAGSTFAWFSSKDEVTNRLTASANYNVSIVEDFQPPADWLPGQTINKDVAAVNTGNVDAFVRMWLDGKLRLLKEDAVGSEVLANNTVENVLTSTADIKAVTDPARTKLGLNFYKKNGNTITYYKTLRTAQIDNPNDINHTSGNAEDDNEPAALSEVQSMQAAGILAFAPNVTNANAKYTWVLEQAEDLYVYDGTTTKLQTVAAGTKVGTVGSTGATVQVVPTGTADKGNYYGAIDASTFQPETTGLYLFKRNIGDTADGEANTYEYSGYYFVKAGSTNAPSSITNDTYFALHTETAANKHSDYVVPADAVEEDNTIAPTADLTLPVNPSGVKLFSATENVYDKSNGLTWTYDNTNKKFTVTQGTGGDAVTIEIALANIGTAAEAWTAIAPSNPTSGTQTTFYYNNDLEAGDTTRKLVDNVTLSSDTKVGAYLAFDFDLNVFLDSVQITLTEENGESDVTVENGWAVNAVYNEDSSDGYQHQITAAKGVADNGDVGEINTVTWSIFTGS